MEVIKPNTESVSAPIDVDQFRRIEDKFLLKKEYSSELIQLLFQRMQSDHRLQQIKVEKNQISSLYFESDQFRLLTAHLEGQPKRFKIRIRSYRNEDPKKSSYCIEFKEKSYGVSSKKRIWINKDIQDSLIAGHPIEINDGLQKLNPNLSNKKLSHRVELFNGHISKYRLKPTISILYHRTAVEFDKLRVTVDHGLQYHDELSKIDMSHVEPQTISTHSKESLENFDPTAYCILEVKHQNHFPDWLQVFLDEKKIPKNRFSKYCWSLVSVLKGQLFLETLLPDKTEVI